jgi:hypothetical protein
LSRGWRLCDNNIDWILIVHCFRSVSPIALNALREGFRLSLVLNGQTNSKGTSKIGKWWKGGKLQTHFQIPKSFGNGRDSLSLCRCPRTVATFCPGNMVSLRRSNQLQFSVLRVSIRNSVTIWNNILVQKVLFVRRL